MNTLTALKRLKITACYAKRWKPPSTEYNKRGLRQHLHKIIFIKISDVLKFTRAMLGMAVFD